VVGGHSLSHVAVNSDITLPSDGNINFIIFMLLSMLNRTSSTFHKRDRGNDVRLADTLWSLPSIKKLSISSGLEQKEKGFEVKRDVAGWVSLLLPSSSSSHDVRDAIISPLL
jgi:hypothetical protein